MKENITDVRGILARGAHIGIKSKRRDLAIIYSDVPASVGGVFTTNKVCAEPVKLSRDHIKDGIAQAIVVTSGNANACTGEKGKEAAEIVASTLAEELGIRKEDVIVSATGVIGEPYPTQKVVDGIRKNVKHLSSRHVNGAMVANAIMTTDTFQKEGFLSFKLGPHRVNLAGVAKGSGMIHPDMATMLGFLVCDANIDPPLLQEALRSAVNKSFNMISVDGDTSTNDMVAILSNGRAGNRRIKRKNKDYGKFLRYLERICTYLAKSIVSDGEGATKFIEYKVVHGRSFKEGKAIIRSVSNSNLVRTAIFGNDPNWGRIIAAIGRSGVDIDPDSIDIHIGSRKIVQVASQGCVIDFNRRQLKQMMRSSRIRVIMDLNQGETEVVGWGTDFSYEYVRINAEYTT